MFTRIPSLVLGVFILCAGVSPLQNTYSQSLFDDESSLLETASDQRLGSAVGVGPDSLEFVDVEQTSLFRRDTWPSATDNSQKNDSGRLRMGEIFPVFYTDSSLEGMPIEAEPTRSYGSVLFVDYDAFMGRPDAGWTNNGIRAGINFANRLGALTDRTGICSQIGASMGVYDWSGTDYRLQNKDRAETQGFLTYGFYCRPTAGRRMVGGLVQDWSFNDTYGVFGQNPVMSQLRGQLGYAVSASNEFGLSGATPVVSSTRNVRIFGETHWRPISRLSWYWHHKWQAFGPDTWISIGVPSHNRLSGEGSVGDYVVSAIGDCPLNDVVSLVSGVAYMHPSASPGAEAAKDEMWNFSVGISIYLGRNARSATIAGQQHMPLLPVADNGSFIVDTNKTY